MLRRILNSRAHVRSIQLRSANNLSVKPKENVEDRMHAWQIHSYGGLEELKLSNVRIPVIARPTDVLVKVEASSINPIDLAMTRGYGAAVLNVMRKARTLIGGQDSELELPLTLGRDFSGIVVSKGHSVGNRLEIGDKVWGVVPVEQQGCHASFVVVDKNMVNHRPHNLNYIEAASVLYAGLTAWSALWITGGLCYKTTMITKRNKRVLVLGGSGGVGTLAIQLLKSWNMHVVTTCSNDAVSLVEQLGADIAINYKSNDADSQIIAEGPYDIILDCANQGPEEIRAKRYPYYTYITLNSPLLRNVDQHGLLAGAIRNIGELLKYNNPIGDKKGLVKWGFFVPSQTGMNVLQELVENGELVPVVQQVYPFQELPTAYAKAAEGHLRGKIVIDMG